MTVRRGSVAGVAILAALVTVVGCSGSTSPSTTTSAAPPASAAGGGATTTFGPPSPPGTLAPSSAGLAKPLFDAACAGTLTARQAGTVQDPALAEISGVVASIDHPGVLWVHNDSGGKPAAYAIDPTGRLLGTWTVAGAENVDWEDIALVPGASAGQSYLYLADIGDNNKTRPAVVVYRVPEPAVSSPAGSTAAGSGPATGTIDTVDKLTLYYPDAPHNAEALLVDPVTGELVIITKEDAGPARVFTAPPARLTGAEPVPLDDAGTLDVGPAGLVNLVTGADISPAGDVIAVRTYGGVRLYARAAGQTVVEALGTKPCNGAAPLEKQGEAVGFAADGRSFYTISEGEKPPVNQVMAPTP